MSEIRWFCEGCLEDQMDDIWAHWDRDIKRALCPTCRTKIAQGGQNDDRSGTNRNDDNNGVPRDAGADEAGMQEQP